MALFGWFCSLFSFNITLFIISLAILFSLCFGVLFASSEKFGFPNLLKILLFYSFFLLGTLFVFFVNDFASLGYPIYYFSQYFQAFFLILAIFILLASRDFISARKISKFEYDIMLLFVFLSSIGLCFVDDFLLFYLIIELQSLCFYVFATFNRKSEFSTESGLKYFVFGGIMSCFLLLGFSLVYILFGSTSFEYLSCLSVASSDLPFFGICFIMITLLFKVGAAPFHFWLCDVYDGSLLSVTLLFASAPKIILFSVIIKIFFLVFFNFNNVWLPFFLLSALFSILIGSVSAIYQKRVKRLLAYSTISHTGFVLFGIVCMSIDSINSLIFYLVIYSGLTVLLFSLLIFANITSANFPAFIASWTSAGLCNYTFILSFSLVLFSIAGIPPLAGFFSKFMIILSLITQEYYLISLIIVIISSIACFYYIRLIKAFFFVKTNKNNLWISVTKRQNSEFLISFLLFLNLTFCLFPDLLALISSILTLILF